MMKPWDLMIYFFFSSVQSGEVQVGNAEYVGCYSSMLILPELIGIYRSRIVDEEGGQS